MKQLAVRSLARFQATAYWPYLLVVLVLGIVARICQQTRIPMRFFVQDIFVLTQSPAHWGLLSNVGAFLWMAALTLGLFGSSLLKNRQPALASLLGSAGLLSGIMLLDDFFTLHETVIPALLGAPQSLVVGLELVVWGIWFAWHWRTLRQIPCWPHLLFCCLGFGGSLLIDQVLHRTPRWGALDTYFWEDGLKLVGIVAWLSFVAQTSLQALRQRLTG